MTHIGEEWKRIKEVIAETMEHSLGASTSWNPLGLSRPVMGLLYISNYL